MNSFPYISVHQLPVIPVTSQCGTCYICLPPWSADVSILNVLDYKGHEFLTLHFRTPTTCDSCNKPMWHMLHPPPAMECRRKYSMNSSPYISVHQLPVILVTSQCGTCYIHLPPWSADASTPWITPFTFPYTNYLWFL